MEHEFQHGDEVKYLYGKTKYPKQGALIVQRVTADYVVCLHIGEGSFATLELNPQFLQLKAKARQYSEWV